MKMDHDISKYFDEDGENLFTNNHMIFDYLFKKLCKRAFGVVLVFILIAFFFPYKAISFFGVIIYFISTTYLDYANYQDVWMIHHNLSEEYGDEYTNLLKDALRKEEFNKLIDQFWLPISKKFK